MGSKFNNEEAECVVSLVKWMLGRAKVPPSALGVVSGSHGISAVLQPILAPLSMHESTPPCPISSCALSLVTSVQTYGRILVHQVH